MSTLYRKEVGDNGVESFTPIADELAFEGLQNGSWLVTIDKGRRQSVKLLDTDRGREDLLAAAKVAKDAMCRAVVDASQAELLQPQDMRQVQAWTVYSAIIGHPDASVQYSVPAASDICQAGINALAEQADKLRRAAELEHPDNKEKK